MSSRWPDIALTIVVLLGIILCVLIIAFRHLTNTESLLLSLVLTILSLIGSWVASRHYSEVSFNNNLRVFALKAAEKVNNLSKELDRLSAFLQHELEPAENYSPDEALLAKEASIEAAIHIINTLKSVNDTSLSDWQGVIGDELSAQKIARQEEIEEREEDLRELVDRIELLSAQIGNTEDARDNTTALLSKEMTAIKSDLRALASQVGGLPLRRSKSRQELEIACPSCSALLKYRQKTKEGTVRSITCEECKSKLVSTYTNGSFVLTRNEPQPVSARCPVCTEQVQGMLLIVPGQTSTARCPACTSEVTLIRAKDEVRARAAATTQSKKLDGEINEDIIRRVQQAMPSQPWPQGAAKMAAAQLGLPLWLVSSAVRELIKRGAFDMQVDGELYRKIPHTDSTLDH